MYEYQNNSFSVPPTVHYRCDGTFDAWRKTIKSPNYPSNYGNGDYCTWNITAPIGKKIEIKKFNYSLEVNPSTLDKYGCHQDYLIIFDCPFACYDDATILCGNGKHNGMISSGNNLFLLFNSDSSEVHPGFQVPFSVIDMNDQPNIKTALHQRIKSKDILIKQHDKLNMYTQY